MWGISMYELMAHERIATYQREAAQDRIARDAAGADRPDAGATATVTVRAPRSGGERRGAVSGRRALAAAFVGLAAVGALRWRR